MLTDISDNLVITDDQIPNSQRSDISEDDTYANTNANSNTNTTTTNSYELDGHLKNQQMQLDSSFLSSLTHNNSNKPIDNNDIDLQIIRNDQIDNLQQNDFNQIYTSPTTVNNNNLESNEPKNIVSNDTHDNIRGYTRQQQSKSSIMAVFVGILTALGGFLYGYDTGIINGLLEMKYVKRNYAGDKISFTASETAIITGTLSIGTFVGSLCAPIVSDRFGRRKSIIGCTSIFFFVGVLIQTIKADYSHLCAGRFISGFGVGMISAIIPLYQAEASPKWIRGSIISFYQWAITWGLLVSSAVTQITHKINDPRCYRIPIAIQFIWATMLCVGMYLLPESPRFYVKKDKLDDAIVSLSRFRRLPINDESLIEELIEIKASHDYEMSFGESTLIDCFKSSPSRPRQGKRMMTGMALQALQQCSGINFIFYYGVNFFVKTGVNNSYLMSFVTYAVNVCFTIPGIFLVEIMGRRKLLIFGAAGMTVSNYVIAIVGCTTDSIVSNKVLISFVCTFIAFFAATWGPLSWVLVGEMYSLSVRQKAVSITAATNWLVNFVFAYSTPYLIDSGNHTAALGAKIFFIWGSLNLTSFVFAYLFVYETKGLMLEEIDELFRVCKSARNSEYFKPGLINHDNLPNSNGGGNNEIDDSNDGSLSENKLFNVTSTIHNKDIGGGGGGNNTNIDNNLTNLPSNDLNHIRNMITHTTSDSYNESVNNQNNNSNNNNYITKIITNTTGGPPNNPVYKLNFPLGASIPNSLYTSRSSEEGDDENNYDFDDEEEEEEDDDDYEEDEFDHHISNPGRISLNSSGTTGFNLSTLINSTSGFTNGNNIISNNNNNNNNLPPDNDSDYSYTNQEELRNFIENLAVDRFGVDGNINKSQEKKDDDI